MMLTVTEKAATNLQLIVSQRVAEGQGVRIIAQDGCCGGSFAMGIDTAEEQDAVVEVAGVRFILDPAAAERLEGASIDYVDEVMRRGFRIDAPNAPAAGGGCSCGGH